MSENHTCGRPGCDASFHTQLGKEYHIVRDHGSRREEIDNYPRPPEVRK